MEREEKVGYCFAEIGRLKRVLHDKDQVIVGLASDN